MTNTIRLLLFLAFTLSAAFAQTWAQPVRDVEKEARLSVQGKCSVNWLTGSNNTWKACTLYTVPAGKLLAVRNVSSRCKGNTGNGFTDAAISGTTASNEVGDLTMLGYTSQPSLPDYEVVRWFSTPVFHHVSGGQRLMFSVSMNGNGSNFASPGCVVSFQGFLIDQN